ncbi:MAG: addiction module antitoxin [Anaerolinea sp.]|nr:addiction module antitoxin [Anaerolinea sp.]
MPSDLRSLEFTPEFKRNLRILSRKYRHIRSDIDPLLAELQEGITPGDQVTGMDFVVFKTRVKNRDAQKGKSGGYRIIYYLAVPERIILVTIYSKTEQSDISTSQIRRILQA